MNEIDLREILESSMGNYLKGKIQYHQANVEVFLRNPAGIGEHPNIMESLESELGKIAEYREKLDVLGEIV
jgi:hypothetical protein